jgi:hypothetical protein
MDFDGKLIFPISNSNFVEGVGSLKNKLQEFQIKNIVIHIAPH